MHKQKFLPRTGIDIVLINRIEKSITRHGDRFLKRIFSPEEIAYCSAKKNPYPSYAGRFAVKEAVMKLLGKGLFEIGMTEISVSQMENGEPVLHLEGRAKERAEDMGTGTIAISISHEKESAVAVAFAIVEI